MRKQFLLALSVLCGLTFFSCKKHNDSTTISTPPYQIGKPVSASSPLSGTIKGTMTTGNTYTVNGDVTINATDTLLIQPGVKINITGPYNFIVKGKLLSLGTKENPIWFTSPSGSHIDNGTPDPTSDPANAGLWGGIEADSSCKLLVLKWTHIEFTGATLKSSVANGLKAGNAAFGIYFCNVNGVFVMEDSWMYGSVDDAVRFAGGKISMMRNTFEKCGANGGDVLNAKSGTVGDMAYNLFVGDATNGTKASNKGGSTVQCNINMYNNTYVNCGYRQIQTGRGGCINYEEGSKGKYYNNLVVDCKFGPRIVQSPPADTLNTFYGYTWQYGDSASVVNQFYPVGYITHPQQTDMPNPSFLPSNYKPGAVYNASSLVGKNDPKFVNYPLPNYNYQKVDYVGTFNFHLQPSSPVLGKGYQGFSALSVVPVDPKFGATEITKPGKDLGAFQADGTGNQH
jgi:hypothetical protein